MKALHIYYLMFSHKTSMKHSGQEWLLSVCKWGNQGPERLSNEPKVAQQVSARVKTQYYVLWFPGKLFQLDRPTSALDKCGLSDNFISIWNIYIYIYVYIHTITESFYNCSCKSFAYFKFSEEKSKRQISSKNMSSPETYLCVDITPLG